MMKNLTTQQIRDAFTQYFAKQQHQIVPSSALIPGNDPTLLFTNAGMVQFKDVFLGDEKRAYQRAVSVQRCVRAGGKHNDLDNVGYTARHHTFFEMLGNFSFGDYFKREAIQFAWQFLTQTVGIPEEKLWITIYEEDEEAANIWLGEMKVDPTRFSRCGKQSNFWAMGDTGPCGPCSEIFYDHGVHIAGGPPGSPDEDGDRYVEIWNLVFMQYNRHADGTLEPLPKPSVDTGMGLERVAAVLQGVHNNYDIDLFKHILNWAVIYFSERDGARLDTTQTSLRVLADHIRSCAFLIVDGVRPSNEGRGYVLRRIIRRAIRHGYQLGLKIPFFSLWLDPLVEQMGAAYPELVKMQAVVKDVLQQEEAQFARTLKNGMTLLNAAIEELPRDTKLLSGEVAFKLYDTYGFPLDLTQDCAREKELNVDVAGFEACMQQQRAQSQAASQFQVDYNAKLAVEGKTVFHGYEVLQMETQVLQLLTAQGQPVTQLKTGEAGIVVLAQTPFYAESGGQVGDTGVISGKIPPNPPFTKGGEPLFVVEDTQKQSDVFLHYGHMQSGELSVNITVQAIVDTQKREATKRHHSATHLLHAALRQVLGEHVVQKGSLVSADRLRFDFAHTAALTPAQWQMVEQLVNQQVVANTPIDTAEMSMQEAVEHGAMALFGEKYGESVRVLSMGKDAFSVELCGGTHAARTGDIGLFKLLSEGAIASGVRRIEAVAGMAAVNFVQDEERLLNQVTDVLRCGRPDLLDKLQQVIKQKQNVEKERNQLGTRLMNQALTGLIEQARQHKEIFGYCLVEKLLPSDLFKEVGQLRDAVVFLKQLLASPFVIILAMENEDKVQVIIQVSPDLLEKGITAPKISEQLNGFIAGKGGGKPELAQSGGTNPKGLDNGFVHVEKWLRETVKL